jgi:GT2 family glycosyltransferase
VVLGHLLSDLGISIPNNSRTSYLSVPVGREQDTVSERSGIPDNLLLTPIGRWPTRLSEETLSAARSLPIPAWTPDAKNYGKPMSDVCPASCSIVLVTHNGLVYTKLCLTAVLRHGWNPADELIIVDNASTDGTQEYLREFARLNPFVRLTWNDRNLGFAAANNQGLLQAQGDVLILLNNDTLPTPGWRDQLVSALRDPSVGLVGPVTNRTCNEAQIDAPYRTYGEMLRFAGELWQRAEVRGQRSEVDMLAMFCLAIRREVFQQLGLLDEKFGIGMFEDDDYARRAKQHGYRIVCAEDTFVHHFGQGSFGELCKTGEYDRVFETNRRQFETKWGVSWQPHGRRITSEYRELRARIKVTVSRNLPKGAAVAIISKGDEELLKLTNHSAWHFPRAKDGSYPNIYPADSTEAINHLETLREKGAHYLLIPKTAFWWLDHYLAFKAHLERRYAVSLRDPDTCVIFNLGGAHA